MKSLKRTLCLVLALVMVLGLFGIASATSFTDDNSIQYKEAVDVMTGIGAINGMGDGTFNPKGTITRAQAAKLVTYTVLGEAAAERLTGVSSSFTDVTVEGGYGWAIPSIEYLVKEGTINGMGDGTFDPNGEISGYAVLKLLLCSLGRGARGEYVGNQWDLNVAIDAGKAKLTDGRVDTSKLSNPATREEVALYCFNTIQRNTTQYVATLDIYVDKDDTIKSTVYGGVNGLKKIDATTGTDIFGAPANVWTYNNKTIGAYAVGEILTYTGEQTLAKVGADLKGYDLADVDVMLNGEPQGAPNSQADGDEEAPEAPAATPITAADIKDLTGNGTVVKVYATGTTVNTVVQIKTDVAEVEIIDAAKKVVTLDVKTGVNAGSLQIKDGDDFYGVVSGLAEGDKVLVTFGKDAAVAVVTIPTQVTGRVTTVNVAQKTVTLNGTTPYGIAATTTSAITAPDDADSSTTLWLDGYGYVVASKSNSTPAAKFAYVLETYTTLTGGKLVNMAKVVYPNGSTGDIAINNVISGNAPEIEAGDFVVLGPPSSEGVYDLDSPGQADVAEAASNGGADIVDVDEGDSLVLPFAGGGSISATDKALTADSQGDGSDPADDYVANYYASTVKFIYIKDKNVTVLEGVQNVTLPADYAVAILERHSATDAQGVVTAVILSGINPTGAIDTSKLVYLPATATANAQTGVVDATPSTEQGHAPVAAPVATTTLHDTSSNKDVKVPVYNAYINGVQQPIPSTTVYVVTTQQGSVPMSWNMVGFYVAAPVTNVPGQYELTPYDDTNEETKVIIGQGIDSAFETILTVDGESLQTSGANFVDVRAADQQTANPIILTAKGVAAALNTYDLNVSVVYSSKTGAASLIYINSATPTDAGNDNDTGDNEPDADPGTITITIDSKNVTVSYTSGNSGTGTLNYGDSVANNAKLTVAGSCTGNGWSVTGGQHTVTETAGSGTTISVPVKVTDGTNEITITVTVTVTSITAS